MSSIVIVAALAGVCPGYAPHVGTVVEVRSELEGDWGFRFAGRAQCERWLEQAVDGPAEHVDLRVRGPTISVCRAEVAWAASAPRDASFRRASSVVGKGIDMTFVDERGGRVVRRGFYRLVNGDELRIYLAEPGQARPARLGDPRCRVYAFARVRR
jgi:hypothetical protein